MTSDFYKIGYDLTLANVKSLIRVSYQAAEVNDFGVACSLNILAAEEALKAMFLIIKHHNPQGNITNFEKIFRHHTVKHDELKHIIEFHDVIQRQSQEFLSVLEPILTGLNEMTEQYKLSKLEIINSLNDDYRWFKAQSEKRFDLTSILKWLTDANTDKNKGLYVDKVNDRWISPSEISKEKFDTERHFTQSILDHVVDIEEMFNRVEKSKNLR